MSDTNSDDSASTYATLDGTVDDLQVIGAPVDAMDHRGDPAADVGVVSDLSRDALSAVCHAGGRCDTGTIK